MAFMSRRHRLEAPGDALLAALNAEGLTEADFGGDISELRTTWTELNAECGVPAQDFVRLILRRPYRFDPVVLDRAARTIADRRGTPPPADKWSSERVVALAQQIFEASLSGASGDEVQALLSTMPDYPANTATLIMEVLRPLGRAQAQLGPLLNASAAEDPILALARQLIRMASQNDWQQAGFVALDACDPDREPNVTGETGVALVGALVGLLYREITPNHA